MSIGKNIRKYRKEHNNMSAKELASKVDLKSAQAILQYEREERQPNIETLIKIADALEIPVQYLIEPELKSEVNILMELLLNAGLAKQNLDILSKSDDDVLWDFQSNISFLIRDTLSIYKRYENQSLETIEHLNIIIGMLGSYVYLFDPQNVNFSLKEISEFIKFKLEILKDKST